MTLRAAQHDGEEGRLQWTSQGDNSNEGERREAQDEEMKIGEI